MQFSYRDTNFLTPSLLDKDLNVVYQNPCVYDAKEK